MNLSDTRLFLWHVRGTVALFDPSLCAFDPALFLRDRMITFGRICISIPAEDMQRVKHFYDALFGTSGPLLNDGSGRMGMLIASWGDHPNILSPDNRNTLIYLDASPDLNTTLARIEESGGLIIIPKTSIGELGYFATFADTEGNVLALHSVR